MTETRAPPMQNSDLLAVRAFVTAQDSTQYNNVHASTVVIDLTHSNLKQRHVEQRFNKGDSLATLRQRIHQKTGTSAGFQHLQVYGIDGSLQGEISPETPDHLQLGTFGIVVHGMRIHCVDLNPHSLSAGGGLENTDLVEKYVMSEETYTDRENTLRSWARDKKQADPSFSLRKHAREHALLQEAVRQHKLGLALPAGFVVNAAGEVVADEPDEDEAAPCCASHTEAETKFGPDSIQHCQLNARCQVSPGERRGRVAWVGAMEKTGYWVGVILDEPVGHNNGTGPDGVRHFETSEKYGVFCRGSAIEVGDFPERDLFDSDDEDEL